MNATRVLAWTACLVCTPWSLVVGAEPPPRTSLSDPTVRYQVPERGYVVLARGDVEAVVVDNRAVSDERLPGHRAGYSGIASLQHAQRREDLFVPDYAGLNFEHIHDGTTQEQVVLFEPRYAPMELRVVDAWTAELYQAPTPTWHLESCLRYHLLEDGTIEMTCEFIPRQDVFRNDYIGLFWASYIHRPESLDIHFRGIDESGNDRPRWIRGVTPAHGIDATHRGITDQRRFPHDPSFPLSLVFNFSKYRYTEPWYYGVSHGMAFVMLFRPQDQIRLSQSPTGGGQGNPAWDFQYFIEQPVVGRRYQIVLRAMYLPYQSPEQVEAAARAHLEALRAG